MRDAGTGAGESKAVHDGVGVADEAQGLIERGRAALIDGFAEQEDGAAVVRRGGLQLGDCECESIEDRCFLIARLQVVELGGSLVSVGCKGQEQMRLAVEADDGNGVIDVADEGLENDGEILIVGEMARSCASGFNDNGERERLRIRIGYKGEVLLGSVVSEGEVARGEGEDWVAILAFDHGGDFDEGGAYRDRCRGGRGLLRVGDDGDERKRESEDEAHEVIRHLSPDGLPPAAASLSAGTSSLEPLKSRKK